MSRWKALFGVDLRSLAAMRVGLGVTALYCFFIVLPDLATFYSDEGLIWRDPSAPHQRHQGWSLLFLSDGLAPVVILWILGVVSALAFALGLRTRIAAIALWIVWLSFTARNNYIVQAGDQLMALLLFWSIFLPVGGRFSIDHALTPDDKRGPEFICNVATVGLLAQVLYVYVFGALLKTSAVWETNGSAIYLAMHLDGVATELALWFRQYGVIMMLLTFFVYSIELYAPVLLFFPDRNLRVRSVTLALLIAMHIGFRVFLRIGHFWMTSLSSLCAYIPSAWWNFLQRRYWSEDQRRIEIWYDRDCGFCLKTALILREFFLPRATPVRPAQDHDEIGPILEREVSWVVVDGQGRRLLHWDAVSFVMRQSVILRPIGWLAALYGAIGLGRPTYDLIGRNRRGLGFGSRLLAAPKTLVPRLNVFVSAFLVVAIAAGFLVNMKPYIARDGENPLPSIAMSVIGGVGWNQRWGMFAPSPPLEYGYPVVTALMPEPAAENLYLKPPVAVDQPVLFGDMFPSYRWRKYFENIHVATEENRQIYLSRYARHACAVAEETYGRPAEAVRITARFKRMKSGYAYERYDRDWGDWPCAAEG